MLDVDRYFEISRRSGTVLAMKKVEYAGFGNER